MCDSDIVAHVAATKNTYGLESHVESAIDSGASGAFLLDHIVLQVRKISFEWLFVNALSTERL